MGDYGGVRGVDHSGGDDSAQTGRQRRPAAALPAQTQRAALHQPHRRLLSLRTPTHNISAIRRRPMPCIISS
eukprot:3872358-Pyramimonas_sp.AAC.1